MAPSDRPGPDQVLRLRSTAAGDLLTRAIAQLAAYRAGGLQGPSSVLAEEIPGEVKPGHAHGDGVRDDHREDPG